MSKIKNGINQIRIGLKVLFSKLPVTLTAIFLLTIFSAVTLDMDIKSDINVLEIIYSFLGLFIIFSFFIETTIYDFKNKILNILSYIVSVVITSLFVYIFYTQKEYFFGINIDIVLENATMILAGIVISLILISLYKMYIKSKLNFNEYVFSAFTAILKVLVFDVVLCIGVSVIYFLFRELILSNLDITVYLRMMILVQGLFFAPAIIKAIYNDGKKEENNFFKVLVLYIVLPLFVLISFILYIYIVKIFIQKEIPSNFIYPVVSSIFIVGFFIFNFIRNYRSIKFIDKVSKIIPYYLIPLIILQIYAIGIRILGYGITPVRYISCMFLIFEIVTLFLMIFKDAKKLYLVIFVFIALTLISTFTPINLLDFSKYNQNARLKKYINIDTELMTAEEKEAFEGAYYYLKYQTNKEKYITEAVERKMNEIDDMNTNHKDDKNDENIVKNIDYYSKTLDEYTDISNFSYIKKVTYTENENINPEYQDYVDELKLAINNLIMTLEKENIGISYYIDSNDNILDVNNNCSLIVNSLRVEYHYNNGGYDIDSIYFNGYILIKEL